MTSSTSPPARPVSRWWTSSTGARPASSATLALPGHGERRQAGGHARVRRGRRRRPARRRRQQSARAAAARVGRHAGDAIDVRVRGNLAFVADGPAGLQVIDVTIANGAAHRWGRRDGRDRRTASTSRHARRRRGRAAPVFRSSNVANPANPLVVGAVDTPATRWMSSSEVRFAYVADYTGSLRGVDFRRRRARSSPGRRRQTSVGILLDVALMDTFVFGADILFVNGVPIIDVSDVQQPAAAGDPQLPRRRHRSWHCR